MAPLASSVYPLLCAYGSLPIFWVFLFVSRTVSSMMLDLISLVHPIPVLSTMSGMGYLFDMHLLNE